MEYDGSSPWSARVTPGIKVKNTSSRFNTSSITSLAKTASSKISNQTANLLAVSWDLGSTSKTSYSRNENFNTYNVVLSFSEIETMIIGQNIRVYGGITKSLQKPIFFLYILFKEFRPSYV